MAATSPVPLSEHISGIILRVERFGDEPPQVLTFKKETVKEVTIGRRSTQPKHPNEPGDDMALFRCPVISRRHARITFAESGEVYISDLNSHHGTHVRKTASTVSTTVQPDQRCYLSNGDVITFGKVVGRDETLVRPVVARIHLIWAANPLPAAPSSPISPSSPVGPTPAGRGSSTGRYGLSSSSSYDSSSSSSDAESDIEEISPPLSVFPRHPLSLPHLDSATSPSGLCSARIGLLRSFLPHIHHVEDMPRMSNRFSPIEVSSASPSRSPSVVEVQLPQRPRPESERNVVGAWPVSITSPRPSPTPAPVSPSYDLQLPPCFTPFNFDVEMSHDAFVTALEVDPIIEQDVPLLVSPQHTDELTTSQSFLSVMQVDENDASESFVKRLESLKARLADCDERLEVGTERDDQQAQQQELTQQQAQEPVVTAIAEPELPVAAEAEHIDVLMQTEDNQLTQIKSVVEVAMKEFRAAIEAEMAQEQAILKAKLAEAEALIAEARALAAKQAAVNDHASPQMPELVAPVAAVSAEQPLTLKRKRDELEEEAEPVASLPASIAAEAPHCCSPSGLADGRRIKRRRSLAMRVVAGVAKTSAIAAVGAVATWSALAFS